MRVKVFTAATVQEAMNQVKSELGIDAVILHTKRFHKGGFLGYMGKEMVEVTAAVDDVSKPAKKIKAPKEIVVPQTAVANYTKNLALESEKDLTLHELNDEEKRKEKRQVQASVGADLQVTEIEKQQAEKIMRLQRELDGMKIMLERVMDESSKGKSDNKSLMEILKDNEIEDSIAQGIVEQIADKEILQNKVAEKTKEALCGYFMQNLRQAEEIKVLTNGQKIVALIGTTGVGKTTTIAKLAANFVLEKGCSVALITADTYRISAVEQLKTYSDIIGLPLEIVYSPSELQTALNKHKDKQLILIDTAGRSQHNCFQMDELRDLVNVDGRIEKHLVLSATTKYKDAVDIVKKFSVCAPDKVLFTKVDETNSIGSIVNLIHQYPITLSYFTNGQSVPDDIILADSSTLAELILR